MKKSRAIPAAGLVVFAIGAVACGTSLYRPLSSKETTQALREETLLQLNQGNYDSAAESAEKLWTKEKSNDNASLYSIALASQAGVGLFDLIVSTIEKSSGTASSAGTSAGNNVFDAMSAVLPTFTTTQLATLKKSIDILESAPDKGASRLLFQRCLTSAIYTLPTIKNLQSAVTTLQSTLTALPARLGSGSGSGCSASADTINTAAAELSSSISSLGTIATSFADAIGTISECFPSSEGKDSLNSVSQQVSKLKTAADKGCTIPATQKIGTFTLPSCLNETINATGAASAVAGDGIIDGCELFLNCTSGSCF
ncbi:MAG: hypothetical protein EBR09_06430 [Proteobacteria bacterium]|nr:hypothetical protein [Pseudomonadota bacterium]